MGLDSSGFQYKGVTPEFIKVEKPPYTKLKMVIFLDIFISKKRFLYLVQDSNELVRTIPKSKIIIFIYNLFVGI